MVLNRKYLVSIVCLIVLIVTVGTCLCIFEPTAFAKTEYSAVLDDLKKDSSFDTSYYPTIETDSSLSIIQLAESVDRELFVYVYQPSGKYVASSINISRTSGDAISPMNYKLELLNSNSVFYKYIVKDFEVSTDPLRRYAITSIYRPFVEGVDNEADYGNKVTEVNFNISKEYRFGTLNGQPYCNVVEFETITVTDKFVGFVRYSDGFKLYLGACDSHFVAFNTDKPIDKLYEADVYYTSQSYTKNSVVFASPEEFFGEKEDNIKKLTSEDEVIHNGGGLFAPSYEWNRIETVEQFISENDLTKNVYSGAILDVSVANKITEEGKEALKGKKWVLRFAETPYSYLTGTAASTISSTMVGDVTILRLKFEYDGIVYNLGVIDNKQSGSNQPINDEDVVVKIPIVEEIGTKAKGIIALIIFIILLIVCLPLIPYVIKFIVWLVSLPFRFIGSGVKSIKKSVKKKQKRSDYEESWRKSLEPWER